LQLLQDRQFSPIDARITDEVDVRMICATSRNLEQEIKSGDFRADLFYRINVASIDLPPLRERREDIPILVRYFLERFGAAGRSMSPELLRSFEEFSWPGNIRQLESVVQRYVVLGSEGELRSTLADPVVARTSRASEDGRMSLKRITREASRELEREIILRVLAENGGNRRKTAKALNISYRALLYKLREAAVAGIEIPTRRRKS
jgi:two-component system response regulator AtoC